MSELPCSEEGAFLYGRRLGQTLQNFSFQPFYSSSFIVY